MAILKPSLISKVHRLLESNGHFCLEDFNVSTPSNDDSLLEIQFRPVSDYSFRIIEQSPRAFGISAMTLGLEEDTRRKVVRSVESPGDYRTTDVVTHEKIDDAITRIFRWTENIRDALVTSRDEPDQTTLDDFYDELYTNIEEGVDHPEAHFDESEKDALRSKLEKLEARIEELEKQLNLTEQDSFKVKTIIDKGKKDLDVYPKGVWYKTSGTKIYSTLKKVVTTPEGRRYLYDTLKIIFTGD